MQKIMDKHDIARLFNEIGILLELQGANPFRIRAYHQAAHTLENLDENLQDIIDAEGLETLPGIGKDLAEKIVTLVETGRLPFYEKLKKSVPENLLELLKIPGLGGKKIKILHQKLKIHSVEDLLEACQKGKVAKLRGFGAKTQENLLKNIAKAKDYGRRVLWWEAIRLAEPILKELRKIKGVKKAEIAGSVRRRCETVGDLDFLVASNDPFPVLDWFTKQMGIHEILAKGKTKASVRFIEGIQADLRVIPEEQFGFSLLYFTGSKGHNIKLRQRALSKGLSLNEYMLSPLKKSVKEPFPKTSRKMIEEKDIYKALGLYYIPPELREEMGEIEFAEKASLPVLVEEKDIRGVFHCHTADSDGHNTLEEMVKAAQALKWEYIGIADHSKSSYQANGMKEEQLFAQLQRIRQLNKKQKYTPHIFSGIECDILIDGKLDFPDSVLKELDYVIVSVHRSFRLDEKKMTARLIKAIENPYSTMVGHVSGRLLLKRDPYALNLSKIIDACIANGKIIEINAHPMRLDMDWRFWHHASERGLKCCINPDAHSIRELEYYKAGINVARKGWLQKHHILNTLPLKKVQTELKKI